MASAHSKEMMAVDSRPDMVAGWVRITGYFERRLKYSTIDGYIACGRGVYRGRDCVDCQIERLDPGIDASKSSTGEISLVPMRRRISTDGSASSSSDRDMISTLVRLGCTHDIVPLVCTENSTRHRPKETADKLSA
jgi:hypothetical protein